MKSMLRLNLLYLVVMVFILTGCIEKPVVSGMGEDLGSSLEENNLAKASQNTEVEKIKTNTEIIQDDNVRIHNGKEYISAEQFLNSPEGFWFQATAYRAAMAYFSNDIEILKEYYDEEAFERDYEYLSLKHPGYEFDFLVLKFSFVHILEKGVGLSYAFPIDDITGFLSISLMQNDEMEWWEWKVIGMALEG